MKNTIGIDVSKDKLDIYNSLDNSSISIKSTYIELKEILKNYKSSIVFYESTGVYSSTVNKVCNDLEITQYTLNPLIIGRLGTTLGNRNKNDTLDAKKIVEIGKLLLKMYQNNNNNFKLNLPTSNELSVLNSYMSNINSLKEEVKRFKIHIDKLKNDIYAAQDIIKFYSKQIDTFNKQIKTIYSIIEKIINNLGYQDRLDNLKTIPSINNNVGIELIIFFINLAQKGLCNKDRNQLKAYVGIDPNDKKSGTSLNRTSISKRGNRRIRSILYMPAMSWFRLIGNEKYNSTNMGLFFQRIQNKFGQPGLKRGKSIIIAMMKKILLTSWGVFRNNTNYHRA